MSKLVTVQLYGHLGKRFGRSHRFAITTPAEAIRALRANFKGFGQYLIDHSKPGFRIITDMGERSAEQLSEPMGGKTIKIVPVVAGAGNGVGQIILGIVLVAVGSVDGFSTTSLGWAMIVGGVSQMLFAPHPVSGPNNGANDKPGYAFNGPVNTTAQGNPVPVCYGRLRVGSQVISGGLYSAPIV